MMRSGVNYRYGSCVNPLGIARGQWHSNFMLRCILVGNVADWSFHIMGSSAVFKRIHWVHITVHILFDNMLYQIFAQCPENISYFPQNFPGFPIPAKSPDSRNIFVFPPKQPLLELSPPVVRVFIETSGECTMHFD